MEPGGGTCSTSLCNMRVVTTAAVASESIESVAGSVNNETAMTSSASSSTSSVQSELFGLPMQVFTHPLNPTRSTYSYLPVTSPLPQGFRKRVSSSSSSSNNSSDHHQHHHHEIASIFSQPSAYLQNVIRNKTVGATGADSQQSSPTKKPRFIEASCEPLDRRHPLRDDPMALHKACRLPHTTEQVLQQLLLANPSAASRADAASSSQSSHPFCHDPGYSYPINLAMTYGVKPPGLALLIQAAPDVLTLPDGPHGETSLHVLLQTRPKDTQSLLLLLLSRPQLAIIRDDRGMDPCQVAQERGASPEAIQYLAIVAASAANASANGQQGADRDRSRTTCQQRGGK